MSHFDCKYNNCRRTGTNIIECDGLFIYQIYKYMMLFQYYFCADLFRDNYFLVGAIFEYFVNS